MLVELTMRKRLFGACFDEHLLGFPSKHAVRGASPAAWPKRGLRPKQEMLQWSSILPCGNYS
jgi:hypothetical protein